MTVAALNTKLILFWHEKSSFRFAKSGENHDFANIADYIANTNMHLRHLLVPIIAAISSPLFPRLITMI